MARLARSDRLVERLRRWEQVLGQARDRHEMIDGIRLTFDRDGPIGEVAELAVAEQQQCRSLRFALTVDRRGAALEVSAPKEDQDLVYARFA